MEVMPKAAKIRPTITLTKRSVVPRLLPVSLTNDFSAGAAHTVETSDIMNRKAAMTCQIAAERTWPRCGRLPK